MQTNQIPDSSTREDDSTMDEERRDVTVIIVTWNVRQYVAECVSSIQRMTKKRKVEIIVVDNASKDGTVEFLTERFPDVRVIPNNDNVGFARANNQGLEIARGFYTLFLNPDTRLVDDAIETLAQFLDRHHEAGLVGPQLLSPDGSIQYGCARRFLSISEIILAAVMPSSWWRLMNAEGRTIDYSSASSVDALSGAAMMGRTAFLRSLGGFGSQFLHCGEDLDLCRRVRALDKWNWYVPSARVFHYARRSSDQDKLGTSVKAVLSTYEYVLAQHGAGGAAAYKATVILFRVPLIVFWSLLGLLARRVRWAEFREQLRRASCFVQWRLPET